MQKPPMTPGCRHSELNDAIDHGKMKHADVAKKAVEEAVKHLKAAQ